MLSPALPRPSAGGECGSIFLHLMGSQGKQGRAAGSCGAQAHLAHVGADENLQPDQQYVRYVLIQF